MTATLNDPRPTSRTKGLRCNGRSREGLSSSAGSAPQLPGDLRRLDDGPSSTAAVACGSRPFCEGLQPMTLFSFHLLCVPTTTDGSPVRAAYSSCSRSFHTLAVAGLYHHLHTRQFWHLPDVESLSPIPSHRCYRRNAPPPSLACYHLKSVLSTFHTIVQMPLSFSTSGSSNLGVSSVW
jgi:hypothetical protein